MPEFHGAPGDNSTDARQFHAVSEIPDIPGRVRDRLDRWRAEVERTDFAPLAEVLRNAAGAAGRIGGGRGGDDDAGRSPDPARLLAALADDVLDPIRDVLDEIGVCAGLPLSLLETMHELRSRAAKLPESMSVPEDEELYDDSVGDTPLTRVRKALVRGGRKLPGASGGPRLKTVPLRDLALFHVIERAGSEVIRLALDRRQQIASSLARLERALSDLTHVVLARSSAHDASDEATVSLDAAAATVHERLLEAAGTLDSFPSPPVFREEWETDVRFSGTFMSENRTLGDEGVRRRLSRLTRHSEEWAMWQKQITDRLAFCVRLIAVRYELDAASRSVRDDLADDLSVPADALDAFARVIRVSASDVPTEALSGQTLEASAWLADTESHLIETLRHSIVEAVPEQKLTGNVGDALKSLRSDTERIQTRYGATFDLHPLPEASTSAIDPSIDPFEVDLGDILRQGLAPLGEEQFDARVDQAMNALLEVLQGAPELRDVIRYNLRAADASSETEESDDDMLPADVVQAGLSRASEAASQMAVRIRERAEDVDRVLAGAVEQAWVRIHERARIQRQMQGAVMDLQREVDVQLRRATESTRSAWKRLSALARRGSRRGGVLVRRMMRRGREAVGAVMDERVGYHETTAALSSLDEMLGQVPPIYRRLFSFSPLTEPELLVGRELDLAFLKKHVALWDVGVPQALILHGNPSSGRTSLLNVFEDELADSHEIVRITIPHDLPNGLSSEADLVALLADAGHMDVGDATSLFELGEHILSGPRPDVARICIVEQLGSLMTRTIGGFDLIAECIALMSRTDSRWLWISTMSESGWKALKSARPEAASLAISRTLEPMGRVGLERLIMQRHQRSGVPIEFLEPPDPSPLLRRRLRTVLGHDQRQRILREAWFDRLFALTGQDIMMALFYWIRSVEMTDAGDRLLVRWFAPVRFDFMYTFSMDQAFALKAILERGALTVKQHADTNLVTLVQSRRILESLGNAMLIEPVGENSSPTRFDFTSIRDDTAYRIRPLVVHPVIRFLQGRNIVH